MAESGMTHFFESLARFCEGGRKPPVRKGMERMYPAWMTADNVPPTRMLELFHITGGVEVRRTQEGGNHEENS